MRHYLLIPKLKTKDRAEVLNTSCPNEIYISDTLYTKDFSFFYRHTSEIYT